MLPTYDNKASIIELPLLTYEDVPSIAELLELAEAPAHGDGAIVGAGFRRLLLAEAAVLHLGQLLLAVVAELIVQQVGGDVRRRLQRLVKHLGGHERPPQLQAQLRRHVAERVQVLHVIRDALHVGVVEGILGVQHGEHTLVEDAEERVHRLG